MITEKLMGLRNVGDKFVTNMRVVCAQDVDNFCTASGMTLDPFLKDEAARNLGFKGRVVPGAFMLGLVFGVALEFLSDHIHVSTNNMKVLAPLYLDDKVRAEIEILNKKEAKNNRVFVTWAWALKNQNDENIAQGENT